MPVVVAGDIEPGGRSCDDDRGTRAQFRQGDRHRIEHADEVNVDSVDEVHTVRISQRHRKNARVGHDDVEAPEFGDAPLDGGAQLIARADVGLDGYRTPAGLLDKGHGLLEVLAAGQRVRIAVDRPADIDNHDIRAFFSQPHRMAAPLTSARASDQRNLSFHPACHVSLPPPFCDPDRWTAGSLPTR